jgi:hypothetical protein
MGVRLGQGQLIPLLRHQDILVGLWLRIEFRDLPQADRWLSIGLLAFKELAQNTQGRILPSRKRLLLLDLGFLLEVP